MATLTNTNIWTLTLNVDELKLIIKALGGRLDEYDYDAAVELRRQISLERGRATKNSMEQANHLLSKVEAQEPRAGHDLRQFAQAEHDPRQFTPTKQR